MGELPNTLKKPNLKNLTEWVEKETPENVARAFMGLMAQLSAVSSKLQNFELKERVGELEDKLSDMQVKINRIEKDSTEKGNDTE